MSTFWYLCFLFGLTVVQLFSTDPIQISAVHLESSSSYQNSDNHMVGLIENDDGLTDQICGTHPLKTILKKIAHARKFNIKFFCQNDAKQNLKK